MPTSDKRSEVQVFQRSSWLAGTLSRALSNLQNRVHAVNTHVTLKSSRPDGTIRPVSGDLELVSKLTDLPVGEAVVLVRFIRDLTDSEMASHADVLTLEQLGSDETVMTFSASESEYRIHVRSRNDDLSQTILVALAADLSLTQKAENQQH